MGSENNLATLASRTTLLMDDFDHLRNFFGLDLARFQPKFEDKFADVIPKALQELKKGPQDIAEADKILESLKAKHEADQLGGKIKKKPSKKHEYRDRTSPYSTASSTPALSPPTNSAEVNDDLASRTCFVCSDVLGCRSSLYRHIRRLHPSAGNMIRAQPAPSDASMPFKCPTCSKGFNKLTALSTHQKRHEPKRFQCPHCSRRYAFSNDFKKHLHRSHKIEYDEMPDDLEKYGSLTNAGEKYENSAPGRPLQTKESLLAGFKNDVASIIKDQNDKMESEAKKPRMNDEAAKEVQKVEEQDGESDQDDDVEELLLQQLSESTEVKRDEVAENAESKEVQEIDDDDDEDVDDLLLQQLNS